VPQHAKAAGFDEVWQKHADAVFRFSLFLSGERGTAQDIVSETFLRLWTAWDRVEPVTLRSYLFTIARNIYLTQLKSRRQEDELPEELPSTEEPVRQAEARDELRFTLAAIQRLPEVDRSALTLRVYEGLPYEEIARLLSIPVSTAKVKVHRARLTLAQQRPRSIKHA
jgi:RNA polymerase sigma-70 factor, ECF subfamily